MPFHQFAFVFEDMVPVSEDVTGVVTADQEGSPPASVEGSIAGTTDQDIVFGSIWFDLVHLIPRAKFEFGNIVSQVEDTFEIYNAFRTTSVTLTSITNNLSPGVVFPTITPPVEMPPSTSILDPTTTDNSGGTGLGTLVETAIRVLQDGLPQFDSNAIFVTTANDPFLLASGSGTPLVGAVRGYFFLGPGNLSWENFMAALLKGRGFVTNGPLLEFWADQSMPGDQITVSKAGGTIQLRGVMRSIVPVDRLEVVHNGKIIEKIPLSGDQRQAEFERAVRVTRSGWYTLQAVAHGPLHPIEDSRPMATTNPIYVYVGDQPIRSQESADYFVRWIDKLTQMALEHPGWRSDKEKQHVLAQFQEAREIYLKRGREAAASVASNE